MYPHNVPRPEQRTNLRKAGQGMPAAVTGSNLLLQLKVVILDLFNQIFPEIW